MPFNKLIRIHFEILLVLIGFVVCPVLHPHTTLCKTHCMNQHSQTPKKKAKVS